VEGGNGVAWEARADGTRGWDGIDAAATEWMAAGEAEQGEAAQRLVERYVLLQTIDTLWIQHLTAMEEMRQGIRDEALWLMAYEQASGDETQTRANYIGLRVRALKDEAVIMGAVADAQKPVEPAKPEATPPLQTPPVVDVSIIKVTITIIGMTWAIMWIAYVLAS